MATTGIGKWRGCAGRVGLFYKSAQTGMSVLLTPRRVDGDAPHGKWRGNVRGRVGLFHKSAQTGMSVLPKARRVDGDAPHGKGIGQRTLRGRGPQKKGRAPAWEREPCERIPFPSRFRPGRGVIHPSFPLRGRWGDPNQFGERAPSLSLAIPVKIVVRMHAAVIEQMARQTR
jgi:hypothetical protein